jgi:hypothetical protein
MTPAEQERDLEEVQTYLSVTTLTAERCRHPTVTETSLWIFDKLGAKGAQRQVASICRNPDGSRYRWRVSRMHRGQPVSEQQYDRLIDCIGDVMRYDPKPDPDWTPPKEERKRK